MGRIRLLDSSPWGSFDDGYFKDRLEKYTPNWDIWINTPRDKVDKNGYWMDSFKVYDRKSYKQIVLDIIPPLKHKYGV